MFYLSDEYGTKIQLPAWQLAECRVSLRYSVVVYFRKIKEDEYRVYGIRIEELKRQGYL